MNEEVKLDDKTCPNCGKTVDMDSRFCKFCAFDLTKSVSPQANLTEVTSQGKAEGKRNSTAIALVCVLLGIVGIVALWLLLRGNSSSSTMGSSYTTSANSTTGSSSSSGSDSGKLTNAKVETAVASMLSDWRLGGSVSVRGIQDIPQQNAAVADLQFQQFEYGTTYEGGLVKAKDFKPKSLPKDRSRMPTMEEMFPQRKAVYSKDGKAILSRYNDGRWVLKEVRWGFDTGVKGTVEIR